MVNRPNTAKARQARHKRVRGKIHGTAECPRLNVFRSLKHIYAQLIDDDKGVTLVSASTAEKDFNEYGGNVERATLMNKLVEVMTIGKSAASMRIKRLIDKGLLWEEGNNVTTRPPVAPSH